MRCQNELHETVIFCNYFTVILLIAGDCYFGSRRQSIGDEYDYQDGFEAYQDDALYDHHMYHDEHDYSSSDHPYDSPDDSFETQDYVDPNFGRYNMMVMSYQ